MARVGRGLGRRGAALLALLVAALAAWIALQRRHAPAGRPELTAAIPRGAILIAEIDFAALRAQPLTRELVDAPRAAAGLGDWKAQCGGDPLDRVDRLAVAVPAAPDTGFGLFASGRIDADWFARCAEKVISARQGKPASRARRGQFVVVGGKAERGLADLAVRDGGPLIVAEPGYLELAMRAASGAAPSAAGEPGHAALVGAGGVLVASVSLTPELRATLADELKKQGIAGSPFASVRGGALQVKFAANDTAVAVASIACDAPSAGAAPEPCRQIAAIVAGAIAEQAKSPLARALGYGALLDRLSVESSAERVSIRGQFPLADVLAVGRRFIALAQIAGAGSLPKR